MAAAPRSAAIVPDVPHPHLDAFLAAFPEERVWGQVLLRRRLAPAAGFELCHVVDGSASAESLRLVPVNALRGVAQLTLDGRYRPWTGAPTLSSGWRCVARDATELAEALHHLYPGSLADAWEAGKPGYGPVDFAVVAERQLGRSKILMQLQGAGLAAAVEAGCGVGACVKRRCWTAMGVAPDDGGAKSAIPCLEPCPFFLGFARTCAEIEQESTVAVEFAPDDLATLAAALRHALEHPPRGLREGELAAPLHPWRVSRVLARYVALGSAVAPPSRTSDE